MTNMFIGCVFDRRWGWGRVTMGSVTTIGTVLIRLRYTLSQKLSDTSAKGKSSSCADVAGTARLIGKFRCSDSPSRRMDTTIWRPTVTSLNY